ncbi:hypothetical protein KB553_14260 [Chryseobacterium rhizoplanae]|uniref:hypothetical protein n=1 Tax=Chryseobacterium TaxID=59732 RepID=UPI0013DE3D64|nr:MULTISPECIES: hypothetical protein [Chryseobacterium]UCA58215.1 hypothetical protein KB553_14260 [Chryseobacterium rhizoplanae]
MRNTWFSCRLSLYSHYTIPIPELVGGVDPSDHSHDCKLDSLLHNYKYLLL